MRIVVCLLISNYLNKRVVHGNSRRIARGIPQLQKCTSAILLALVLAVSSFASQEKPAVQPATSDTPESHLGKGYDALKQDRYDAAASEFRAALEIDPKLTLRARFPLAVALFEMHKSDEARRELEIVRREVGDHPNVLYYLGRLDLDARNFEGAIRNLNQAAAKPPFPDTAYYLGYAYFKQGDLTSAEKWLKVAAETNPRDARVQYQLGSVYRKQGREQDAQKAIATSEEMRQRDTNESRIKLECAQKLDQGPREEAVAICEQLYDPNNAEKLTALGTTYGQHGELERALKPLSRAAELAPQSPQMQYNLAYAHYQLNQLEEARAPLANALQRWPDLFPLNALYGAVLLKLGQDRPAYESLHHAHQLNPQDPATLELLHTVTLTLASQNQGARQYSDALRYFEEAAALRPQDPAPHQRMAEIYIAIGRPAQVKAEQQKADSLASALGKAQ
jgi:tetratricopeptide (TPR) repeat protein